MAAGTLCISKLAAQADTYRATFVAYDATPPSAMTIQGVDRLRSFLADAMRLRDADRERALRDATERGVAVVRNVDLMEPSTEAA